LGGVASGEFFLFVARIQGLSVARAVGDLDDRGFLRAQSWSSWDWWKDDGIMVFPASDGRDVGFEAAECVTSIAAFTCVFLQVRAKEDH
jgi:hypothetical protein